MILPLAILDAAEGGIVEGRTRLMKLVFLAQKEASEQLPVEYDFEPYDYGPYTLNLIQDLEVLEHRHNIIQSEVSLIPSGKKYTYSLNDRYKGNLEEELAEEVDLTDEEWDQIVNQAQEVVDKFNDIPISRLLEHVYNRYEEYTTESII